MGAGQAVPFTVPQARVLERSKNRTPPGRGIRSFVIRSFRDRETYLQRIVPRQRSSGHPARLVDLSAEALRPASLKCGGFGARFFQGRNCGPQILTLHEPCRLSQEVTQLALPLTGLAIQTRHKGAVWSRLGHYSGARS